MSEILVSVIIPAYNREKAIAAAIESVIEQDVENIEILVIDDCSADATVKVVESLTDPRIRLIKHDRNKGEAGARNTGVHAAQGKYIAYLDSDDCWLPGKLKAQLDYMASAPSEVGGVYTLHYRLYQNGLKSIGGYGHIDFESLLTKGANISAGNTLLFRRDLVPLIGDYDEAAPLYVDWDWLLRFLKVAQLHLIPVPYAVYEKNPAFRKGEILKRAMDIFLSKYQDDINRLSPSKRRESMARILLDVARGYAENESKVKAARYYLKAIRLMPFMSAGCYLNMLDGMLGTRLVPWVETYFKRP